MKPDDPNVVRNARLISKWVIMDDGRISQQRLAGVYWLRDGARFRFSVDEIVGSLNLRSRVELHKLLPVVKTEPIECESCGNPGVQEFRFRSGTSWKNDEGDPFHDHNGGIYCGSCYDYYFANRSIEEQREDFDQFVTEKTGFLTGVATWGEALPYKADLRKCECGSTRFLIVGMRQLGISVSKERIIGFCCADCERTTANPAEAASWVTTTSDHRGILPGYDLASREDTDERRLELTGMLDVFNTLTGANAEPTDRLLSLYVRVYDAFDGDVLRCLDSVRGLFCEPELLALRHGRGLEFVFRTPERARRFEWFGRGWDRSKFKKIYDSAKRRT